MVMETFSPQCRYFVFSHNPTRQISSTNQDIFWLAVYNQVFQVKTFNSDVNDTGVRST